VSIFYNRTGAFLVSGIYLTGYDREFVILLVNFSKIYCISLFLCFSSLAVGLVPHCECECLLSGVVLALFLFTVSISKLQSVARFCCKLI